VNSQLQYYKTQQAQWESGQIRVQKPIDSDFQNVITEFVNCSTLTCKACNVQNVSQTNIVKATIGCQAFTTVKNSMTQKMLEQVNQALTNNQDMLAPLAELLGASTSNDIIYNVTNRIMALITTDVISNIQSSIDAQQMVTLSGSSVQTIGLTQSASSTAVQSYLQTTNLMNDVLSQEQWQELQSLINDQNTIDSLGNVVTKTAELLSKLLTNVVGKVVLFVIIMVGVIFLGVVIYTVTQAVRKALKKNHDKTIAANTAAQSLPAFETF
jgi:hypothetical protein